MATAVPTVNMTNPDAEDRKAFKLVVYTENARRAALTPPGTPLPASTNPECKASAEILYAERMLDVHRDYLRQANEVTKRQLVQAFEAQPDEAKRAAALAALQ